MPTNGFSAAPPFPPSLMCTGDREAPQGFGVSDRICVVRWSAYYHWSQTITRSLFR